MKSQKPGRVSQAPRRHVLAIYFDVTHQQQRSQVQMASGLLVVCK
jgi:hypothetical protein